MAAVRLAAAAALLALAALLPASLAREEDADDALGLDDDGGAFAVAPDGSTSIGAFGLAESVLAPAAAPAAEAPLLPPGFALEFPASSAPRSFALAPALLFASATFSTTAM